jgi:type I restriction enzyme S subunit
VKEGKIRKQDVEPLALNEAPFELPANWAWTRIGEICLKTGSGSLSKCQSAIEV